MNSKLLLSVIFFSSACFQSVHAHTTTESGPDVPGWTTRLAVIEIKGTVTDEDGNPLAGVSVLEKGSSHGTTTDSKGNFSIQVNEQGTLLFSMTGRKEKEVPVNGAQTLNVSLEKTANALTDVVVIGYGKQSKRTLTTAVSKRKNKLLVQK